MTKYFLLFLMIGTGLQACGQTPGAHPPAANENVKTTPPPPPAATTAYASAKEGWLVDLDEAYAISAKEGKPILANFTGSDWCGWCKKLDRDVFSKPEFITWAEKNVVLLELDFPRYKKIPEKNMSQNAAMQNALRVTGYPSIFILNLTKDKATGQYNVDALGKAGYTPTPEQFIAVVDKFVNP